MLLLGLVVAAAAYGAGALISGGCFMDLSHKHSHSTTKTSADRPLHRTGVRHRAHQAAAPQPDPRTSRDLSFRRVSWWIAGRTGQSDRALPKARRITRRGGAFVADAEARAFLAPIPDDKFLDVTESMMIRPSTRQTDCMDASSRLELQPNQSSVQQKLRMEHLQSAAQHRADRLSLRRCRGRSPSGWRVFDFGVSVAVSTSRPVPRVDE